MDNLEALIDGRRVVVTGLGILSPVGIDLASSWDGIVNGRSGIGPITHFDASTLTTRIAGEVRDFDVTRWVSPKEAKKMDEFIHYGVATSLMALELDCSVSPAAASTRRWSRPVRPGWKLVASRAEPTTD